MSFWTEIRGIVNFRILDALDDSLVMNIFGSTNWDAEDPLKCSVPCGSEGPLQYNIVPDFDAVLISGNLRDYGEDIKEVEAISEWLRGSLINFVKLKRGGIDSAMLQIHRSRGPSEIFVWGPVDLVDQFTPPTYDLIKVATMLNYWGRNI